jgi:hypothetical protein
MDDGSGVVHGIRKRFEGVADPRVVGRCNHRLDDLLVIAILAVICGADDWTDIEVFGKVRETWLRQFLELPSGIPSHDTFRRCSNCWIASNSPPACGSGRRRCRRPRGRS